MTTFPVIEKFVSINGEGTRAGELSAFIRFMGCNLRCPYCDTKYSYGDNVSFEYLSIDDICKFAQDITNVTLTGGEPMIHDLSQLCRKLTENDHRVEIETNGSFSIEPLRGIEAPVAAQIFGGDPEDIRRAAPRAIALSGAQILDLNMGCPMPKVTSNGEGSALMRDPDRAAAIIRAAVEAAGVPVTVKFRLGWDSFTADEFARVCEAAGAAALCVHGRTREQYYAGRADWDGIARVVRAVSIPVMASGDVFEPQDAVRILEYTGAALCMIGRGSYGNPWLFARAEAALRGEPVPPLPAVPERLALAREHMALAVAEKG
ncbi:MAG: tRNA-dihydrouridine synthase, partial [Clostridia bacterium]|nr:tRNA-dihydrouridine synthase [Clostridia bacterium]